MSEIQELQAKINALQVEQNRIKRLELADRQKAERKRKDEFMITQGIHTGRSDDYWTLTVGKYEEIYGDSVPLYDFYFGYEVQACPTHLDDSCTGEDECDDIEWAFEAKINGNSVMILPASQLTGESVSYDDGDQLLLAGIGMFIRDHMEVKREQVKVSE